MLDNTVSPVLQLAAATADVTATANQAIWHELILLAGSLTASRLIRLPANYRRLAIRNATAGGHALTVGHHMALERQP